MADITEIDRNFIVKTKINKPDIVLFNADEKPFNLYGVFKENGKYRRMPENIAKNVSYGVYGIHENTAGGRVRFVTDSSYVAISADMEELGRMPHFTFAGSIGFDLYSENNYMGTFVPPFDIKCGYEGVIEFEKKEMRDITINFPLYSNVKNLYIGVSKDSVVKKSAPYKNKKPIVYYGSSITQGGCASRPGMSYQSIISRKYDCDFVNLGFSGAAKAEHEMVEYIKKLDMSVFVYDYDHNAPTADHLANTHERMFKAIREEKKNVPIIIMSRPKFNLTDDELKRLKIIKTTYKNAIMSGDKNVYLITGKELTELCADEGTVDGCHPTDFGFASMAKAIGDVIEKNKLLI